MFDDDVRIQENFSIQVEDFLNRSNAKCVTFACLQYREVENMQAFKQWESFGSGCSIVHRDVLEKCSFDMALEHGYGEDVDYGMQVRNAGFDVIYAPQIQILHLKAPVGGFRKPYVSHGMMKRSNLSHRRKLCIIARRIIRTSNC